LRDHLVVDISNDVAQLQFDSFDGLVNAAAYAKGTGGGYALIGRNLHR